MADDPDNPYGDPFEDDRRPPDPIPVEDPGGFAIASAAGELSAITGGAKVLKAAAAVATGLWVLAVITMFWNWYDLARSTGSGINLTGPGNNSVLQALATTLSSTWGYLLVAVLAYGGAMALHGQRMRLLVDAASAADD
jgi:hypothetical protein